MNKLLIDPPVQTYFPGDVIEFTTKAVPPPPFWGAISNGAIQSNSALRNVIAGTVSGFGEHELRSGIGYIEWLINDQQRPTGGGSLFYTAYFSGQAIKYEVKILPTAIEIRDEANTLLTTISYSVVSGDLFQLELNSGFRLRRNGTLLHERTGIAVSYPAIYSCLLAQTVAGSPQELAPPTLKGDWKLRSDADVVWTAPSHGSLSTTAGPKTVYSGATIPGTYTLVAWIAQSSDANALQKAQATINIPALKILGPGQIIVSPGRKIRPKTNYDTDQGAQTSLITWSIVAGGGTVSQGEFTAPTAPGVTILRASCAANSTQADILIAVLPVITNATDWPAVAPGEEVDFNVNIPDLPYFVSVGTVAEGTGAIIPGLPAGWTEKDIFLLVVETANEAVSTPSGYAIVADSPQGTGTGGGVAATRLSMFWKRATVTETAPTVADPGDHAIGQIFAIRNCIATGDPWDVTAGNTGASSTSVSIPGDTTTVVNCLVFLAVSNVTDTATPQTSGFTNADLANLTERSDVNTTQGNGGGFGVATGEKAAIGAYGATTATLANASEQGRMSVALKPAVKVWTASVGSINATSGVWTAPSLAGDVAIISVTNGALTQRISVPILEKFPRTDFKLPWPIDMAKKVLIGESEDGTRTSRIKTQARRSFPVELLVDAVADLNGAGLDTIRDFWDRHHPGTRFILEDPEESVRLLVYTDSELRWEHTGAGINIAFRVKQV